MKTDEEILQQIGKKITQLRIDADYKNYEYFAFDNEISRGQYYRIEKGENITLKTLLKVLSIHKLTIKEFFSDID